MSSRCYYLFISHAWSYDDRYQGVARLLNSVPDFSWRDYSVPLDRPLVDPDTPIGVRVLTAKLQERIRLSSCFILIAGMFVHHRVWVQRELAYAQSLGKPIVGIRRRGQERTPVEVEQIATAMVNWNSASLVEAICRVS